MIGATHLIACAFRDVKAHPGGDGQDVTQICMLMAYGSSYLLLDAIRFVPSHYHTQVVAEEPLPTVLSLRAMATSKSPTAIGARPEATPGPNDEPHGTVRPRDDEEEERPMPSNPRAGAEIVEPAQVVSFAARAEEIKMKIEK